MNGGTTDRPECRREDCQELAVARWHDGMWTAEALCFEHVSESLDTRRRFDEYRDEVTTEANLTTIGSGRDEVRVVPAGAKPFAGPWACIRTVEALEEWVDQHDELVDSSPEIRADGGFGFDPAAEAAAAARNTETPPDIVITGQTLGECSDCGARFEYRHPTEIHNLDPCPGCGSQDWTKWGYRYKGDDIPKEDVEWGND